MKLYLKNVGMIKEANVKLDGLTTIAGGNNTGKSVIEKSLFAVLKANSSVNIDYNEKTFKNKVERIFNKVFKQGLLKDESLIEIENFLKVDFKKNIFRFNKKPLDATFIGTSFVFDLYETLRIVSDTSSILDIEIPYNYLWWDLFIKLSHKSKRYNEEFKDIKTKIEKIINGKFKKIEAIGEDKWVFNQGEDIEIDNISMGIKQFGILYALLENGYINRNNILIFDKPESYLHPEWQIEYAKILVQLIKKGVKVLVTSHSPYMIEALYLVSRKEGIKRDFYFAENGYIREDKNIENSIKKLAEPMKNLKTLRYEEKVEKKNLKKEKYSKKLDLSI